MAKSMKNGPSSRGIGFCRSRERFTPFRAGSVSDRSIFGPFQRVADAPGSDIRQDSPLDKLAIFAYEAAFKFQVDEFVAGNLRSVKLTAGTF